MNLQEIKQAIEAGKKVYWSNTSYEVIKDKIGQYLIKCTNGSAIGLTWQDGTTMNGKEKDFFTEEQNIISMVKNQIIDALSEKEFDYGLINDEVIEFIENIKINIKS